MCVYFYGPSSIRVWNSRSNFAHHNLVHVCLIHYYGTCASYSSWPIVCAQKTFIKSVEIWRTNEVQLGRCGDSFMQRQQHMQRLDRETKKWSKNFSFHSCGVSTGWEGPDHAGSNLIFPVAEGRFPFKPMGIHWRVLNTKAIWFDLPFQNIPLPTV